MWQSAFCKRFEHRLPVELVDNVKDINFVINGDRNVTIFSSTDFVDSKPITSSRKASKEAVEANVHNMDKCSEVLSSKQHHRQSRKQKGTKKNKPGKSLFETSRCVASTQ